MTEKTASKQFKNIKVLRYPYFENDRALIEHRRKGLIKVVTTARGKILGSGIVGESAGELIPIWVLAIQQRLKIGAIAEIVIPYPTLSEVSKQAAVSFFKPFLFSDLVRKVVKVLLKFKLH